MPFSSIFFLVGFLPVVLLVHFSLRKIALKNIFLVLVSLSFYISGEGSYVAIILLSIAANYCFGRMIDREDANASTTRSGSARAVLAVGIVFNVALLAYFKYAGFLVANLNSLFVPFGASPLHLAQVHLPLAISFLTFHAISYLVDIYRGISKAQTDPIKLALYFVIFPHMIAGPVVRYNHIERQLSHRSVDASQFAYGVHRFILGLGKKVLIANFLSPIVDQIFSVPAGELSIGAAWLGALCYGLQIFFDFSGYSDMAIGLGRMFGFHFPENFNNPYWASSITDFWRRWHMTLSGWFRDYLYIPLGGNRGPKWRTLSNLLVVFFLCGLWHGAAWTFVAWGMLHGIFLIFERLLMKSSSCGAQQLSLFKSALRHIYVVAVLLVSWVLFRSDSLPHALGYIGIMFGFAATQTAAVPAVAYLTRSGALALMVGIALASPVASIAAMHLGRFYGNLKGRHLLLGACFVRVGYLYGIGAILIVCLARLASGATNPFIYFRF
ncbi:MAG TPA: MBOAT family O-acyltransferase [Capsulimonadaceae bacterium]|jgi:alginate O-acetyltransferase complex protein AlgI